MARFYQTGTAASSGDLLSIISFFLTNTVGTWNLLYSNQAETYNGNSGDSNLRNSRYFSMNGGYYFLTTGVNDYANYMIGGVLEGVLDTNPIGTPYSYNNQPGYSRAFNANDMAGPYTKYHLFGGNEGVEGNYMYCVLETSSGLFTHFGIGDLNRIGSITGRFGVGLYWNMSASYWRSITSSRHQRMFDSNAHNYGVGAHLSYHQNVVAPTAETYQFGGSSQVYGGSIGGWNAQFIDDTPNTLNGRVMLMPNHVRVWDGAWFRIAGIAPAFRSVRIDNLQAGDIIDTDWMTFPVKAKNAPTGPTSGNYGWAYKFQ